MIILMLAVLGTQACTKEAAGDVAETSERVCVTMDCIPLRDAVKSAFTLEEEEVRNWNLFVYFGGRLEKQLYSGRCATRFVQVFPPVLPCDDGRHLQGLADMPGEMPPARAGDAVRLRGIVCDARLEDVVYRDPPAFAEERIYGARQRCAEAIRPVLWHKPVQRVYGPEHAVDDDSYDGLQKLHGQFYLKITCVPLGV